MLSGSWRRSPLPIELPSEELRAILPDLLEGGLAGLSWQRLRQSSLAETGIAVELRNAYRLQALDQRREKGNIARLAAKLRMAGVQPIVLKGWAVARLYPEPALRPYGDLDLLIRPEQLAAAREVMSRGGYGLLVIDLEHPDLPDLGFSLHELFARSRVALLGDAEVRVLSPEDQLRLLCLHFLRHGAWRPLWLVDIAVALEARPADFDWDLCLGPNPIRADYVTCAIGVAHQLLGARVGDTPAARRAETLPCWLVPAVLTQWEAGPFREWISGGLIRSTLRRPWTLPREMANRWPDPILATVRVHGPFNELPRFPFQVAAYLLQTSRLVRRLPLLLRRS
jgi:Uncharacterised nucleotidyltransferase